MVWFFENGTKLKKTFWDYFTFKDEQLAVSKGQLISKRLVAIMILPKKFDKQYYDTSVRLVFVRFLEELKIPKSLFENNWPLGTSENKWVKSWSNCLRLTCWENPHFLLLAFGGIQQLRGPNFTQFWHPRPLKWTKMVILDTNYPLSGDPRGLSTDLPPFLSW